MESQAAKLYPEVILTTHERLKLMEHVADGIAGLKIAATRRNSSGERVIVQDGYTLAKFFLTEQGVEEVFWERMEEIESRDRQARP